MSRNKVQNIVKIYAQELKKNKFPFFAIYIFGSQVNGKTDKWSDIDVAVVSDKLKRNHWQNMIKLGRVSLSVDDRIEVHGFTREEFKNNANPMAYEIRKLGIKVV